MDSSNLVSIVMTYCDRYNQLINTLNSFEFYKYTDFEVIIVDDGSIIEPINEMMFNSYSFPIYVINMPLKKNYHNPCIPFNVGFSKCLGDKIIIQNAECLHLENILEHVRLNLNDKNYLTYTCFSLNLEDTKKINDRSPVFVNNFLKNNILENSKSITLTTSSWKNHITYRPNALHFTSAITKKNLLELGGFDERFSKGTSFDDDEFLIRIKRMGLNVNIVESFISVHQWHTNNTNFNKFYTKYLTSKNFILLKFVTNKEKTIKPTTNSIRYLLYRVTQPISASINVLYNLSKSLITKVI